MAAKARRQGAGPKQTFVPGGPAHVRLKAHKAAIKGEAGLNAKVTSKIARRYPGKVTEILEAAQSAYHYHHPTIVNMAEPYELQEGGFLNEGLESLGLRPLA